MKQFSSELKRGAAILVLMAGATSFASAQVPIVPDPPQPASVPGHIAKAHQIAGSDAYLNSFVDNGYWCKSPANATVMLQSVKKQRVARPPTQIFDNFYMFGNPYVVSMVLKTSDGLVIWDTLDNPEEVKTMLIPGLQHFGMDPKDIKLAIVTHGHGDHYGGAKYLQDTYHTPIGLSAADWKIVKNAPATPEHDSLPAVGLPPAQDKVLTDGEKITIGDATITIVLTPGHSPGTASSILPVKDHGKTIMMAMWGGTAYPTSDLGWNQNKAAYPGALAAMDMMAASMVKFRKAATAAGAVGLLNTHFFTYDIGERIAKADPKGPNPLVVGTANVQKEIDIMSECERSARDWVSASKPKSS